MMTRTAAVPSCEAVKANLGKAVEVVWEITVVPHEVAEADFGRGLLVASRDDGLSACEVTGADLGKRVKCLVQTEKTDRIGPIGPDRTRTESISAIIVVVDFLFSWDPRMTMMPLPSLTSPPDEDDIPLLNGDISSILSLAGSPSPRSLKVAGSVHNNAVQVLLDSGSTHNFIHPSVAERLALVLHPVSPFRIYVGNGDSLRCSYSCPQTPLLLQGHLFNIDLYLLEGATIILRGDVPGPRPISYSQFCSLVGANTKLDMYELVTTTSSPPGDTPAATDLPPDLPNPIGQLLRERLAIFSQPTGLPPSRSWDHQIHLAANSKPVNVRPYCGTEEVYAIVEAVQKWRQYLLGREFVIRSDQRSLKELLSQVIQTPDQQFYVRKLMGYKFRIEYKTGASNRAADALSRREDISDTATLFSTYARPFPSLFQDIQHENTTADDLLALHAAVTAGTAPPHFSVHNGLLYFKRRLILSAGSPLRHYLLNEYHATPLAGHQGVERTFRRLADGFYWPGMQDDVRRFIASYGQTEVLNRSLEQYLRAFAHERPNRWSSFLTWAELALNCSTNEGLGTSPFQALYGRPPPSLFPTMPVRSRVPAVEEILKERAELLQDIKTHLSRMQQRMRAQANQHRRDISFNVGDMVLLRLHPYRQHSLARPGSVKLGRRYYGPFEVLERIGEVAYRLRLPEGCQTHDVFHVSLLKLFVPRDSLPPPTPLPATFYKGRPLSVPMAAVASRTVLVDGVAQEHWLVRWSDGSNADATWEPLADLLRHFPDLRLEDKAVSNPGGVDTGLNPDVSLEDEDPNPSVSAAPGRPKRAVRPPRKEVRLSCAYYSGPVQEPLGSNGFSSGGLCIHSSAYAECVVVFATRRKSGHLTGKSNEKESKQQDSLSSEAYKNKEIKGQPLLSKEPILRKPPCDLGPKTNLSSEPVHSPSGAAQKPHTNNATNTTSKEKVSANIELENICLGSHVPTQPEVTVANGSPDPCDDLGSSTMITTTVDSKEVLVVEDIPNNGLAVDYPREASHFVTSNPYNYDCTTTQTPKAQCDVQTEVQNEMHKSASPAPPKKKFKDIIVEVDGHLFITTLPIDTCEIAHTEDAGEPTSVLAEAIQLPNARLDDPHPEDNDGPNSVHKPNSLNETNVEIAQPSNSVERPITPIKDSMDLSTVSVEEEMPATPRFDFEEYQCEGDFTLVKRKNNNNFDAPELTIQTRSHRGRGRRGRGRAY
ncbi:unnamed protein product [Cuscuta campestris]|uniref:Reverse transcriptase RNase H-like domain-containing protein n=1 Tax=Cuscuta campestris TaxID=132261 RepID=A0A484M4T7_9ASTE|nr:unnamed protein product [Cuscuta campestris]